MSKLSDRDLKVIYSVLMLVVVALAYFFGVKPNLEERAKVQEEISQLNTKLTELRTKEAQQEQIKDDTDEMNKKINAVCNKFPSRTTSQKAYYMVNELMNESKIEVSSIAISMNDIFFAGSGDVAAVIAAQNEEDSGEGEAAAEGTQEEEGQTQESGEGIQDQSIQLDNLIGYKSSVTISFEGSVKEVQNAVNYITASSAKGERMTLANVSLAFDSGTGGLTGSMIIYMYALEGNGKEYEELKLDNIRQGVTDMFGSFD